MVQYRTVQRLVLSRRLVCGGLDYDVCRLIYLRPFLENSFDKDLLLLEELLHEFGSGEL